MKKLSIITTYWKNSPGGGVREYLINLVELLGKQNNIDLSVIFKEGDDPTNYKINGWKFVFIFRTYFKLRQLSPDIIHTHGAWYCLLPGYVYKTTRNVKLIHTFHTVPVNNLPYLQKRFMQHLLNKCDHVTFVSRSLQLKYEKYLGLDHNNSCVIYAGATFKQVSEAEQYVFREKYGLTPKSIVILAQALTAHELKCYGAKLLIESIKYLKKYYPTIVLILTREGIYSEYLKRYSKLEDVCDNIIFTGDIENQYIPLSICNIYAHITLGEGGVSLALLEAMSMGKPIIASRVGGIPEAIDNGNNGLLIDPNVKNIVDGIRLLICDEVIAKNLAKNAKKTAHLKFTWDQTITQFNQLYL